MVQIKHFIPELYGWKWDSCMNSMVPVWLVGQLLQGDPAFKKVYFKKTRDLNLRKSFNL